jgi:hypothetical protein
VGMVAHTCNPATQEVKVRGSWSKAGLGKSVRPYLKHKLKQKVLGGVVGVQVVEGLPSKLKALCSNSSIAQKK